MARDEGTKSMAKSGAVWGIDIGQCALKALRCRPHEKETNRLVVEAFDYVEYPKLLSQPDADREELIREALETFLSRNEIKGDAVAISVPGQSGLARFIKLPPVESKKIPDIVKYEARQQIPFALEDVVWDYQPLAGASAEEDDEYALELEVGLFAMKRDQIARALQPLEEAGVEVDIIQLAPLSVYNFVSFDRLGNLEDVEFDPENQPESTVVLSLGTDTTDLVITNGFRVWQRNIPIGGSHFTKALTKELKLTFAKAEHLKRNAKDAEDPKAVFQAMRPVFSDLVSEIQRSIGFYMSNNRDAKLSEVIALGNPVKLPGLQRYLSQNLDQPVTAVEDFQALVGGSVTATPQFKENHLSFAVAYGLCVQGLDRGQLQTNLLPEEIVTSRLVRAKKPWAVVAAAMLLAGMTVSYFSYYSSWQTVDIANDWQSAIRASQNTNQTLSGNTSDNDTLKSKFDEMTQVGNSLVSNSDGRLLWAEALKGIDAALPKDIRPAEERQKTAEDVTQRTELHIESLDCQYFEDLSTWFTGGVAANYSKTVQAELEAEAVENGEPIAPNAEDAPAEDALAAEETPADAEEPIEEPQEDLAADDVSADDGLGEEGLEGPEGPSGPGWVIQLTGYHFHNSNSKLPNVEINRTNEGAEFVRKTLLRNIEQGSVMLPDGDNGEMVDVPLSTLGFSHPVLITALSINSVRYNPEASSEEDAGRGVGSPMGGGMPGFGVGMRGGLDAEGEDTGPKIWELRRYDFVVQFAWKPTPKQERKDGPKEDGEVDEFAAN